MHRHLRVLLPDGAPLRVGVVPLAGLDVPVLLAWPGAPVPTV